MKVKDLPHVENPETYYNLTEGRLMVFCVEGYEVLLMGKVDGEEFSVRIERKQYEAWDLETMLEHLKQGKRAREVLYALGQKVV